MSELRINNITDRAGSNGPIIAGVSTVSSTSHMVIPSGPTEMRNSPSEVDLSGSQKILSSGGRGRGVVGGGRDPSNPAVDTMDFIEIATSGNATDFGNLSDGGRDYPSGCGSATRGIFFGGSEPGFRNIIDYVVMSSSGGANDFGDMLIAPLTNFALSNATRGISAGGLTAPAPSYTTNNSIEFITIASAGDATNFGDLSEVNSYAATCASPTRGIFNQGSTPTYKKTIEYITIATLGNATRFGDSSKSGASAPMGASSTTRGVFAGGQFDNPYPQTDIIDYITIATEGNAQDFGDLTAARSNGSGLSNSIRGCFAGGSPSETNVIEFVTIASTGNASDFGDLTVGRSRLGQGAADAHGGIGR